MISTIKLRYKKIVNALIFTTFYMLDSRHLSPPQWWIAFHSDISPCVYYFIDKMNWRKNKLNLIFIRLNFCGNFLLLLKIRWQHVERINISYQSHFKNMQHKTKSMKITKQNKNKCIFVSFLIHLVFEIKIMNGSNKFD